MNTINQWAIILGGSSGYGLATATFLAEKGYNIFVVHRDRRMVMPEVEKKFDAIKSYGVQFKNININALSDEGKELILSELESSLGEEGEIRLMLHSIALGNVGILAPSLEENKGPVKYLSSDHFNFTVSSMGTSFFEWTKLLFEKGLFAKNARVLGLTSEGSHKVMPGYSAVSAAKSMLESLCKSMAIEFGPHGIRVNLINAGVADTPALKTLPNYEEMIERVRERNPLNRLTEPMDVAKVIYLLGRDEANWINGSIIRVDGGEQIVF